MATPFQEGGKLSHHIKSALASALRLMWCMVELPDSGGQGLRWWKKSFPTGTTLAAKESVTRVVPSWWPCAWIAKTWSALSAPPAVGGGWGGGGGGGGNADVLSTITMPRKVRVVVDPSSFSGMPNCSSIPYMAS